MNSDVKFALLLLGFGLMMIGFAWWNPGWLFQENGRVYGLGSIVRYFGRNAARAVVAVFGTILVLGCLYIFWLM